ncbi:hypothetical protein THAPS_269314, partial [Thalassiosira pseudonana CCMP1335]
MRDAAATTTETTTTTAAAGRTSPNHQPPGWRVKLYRLNMDGTWDDCGTGRIQFYYARQNHNQMQQQCGGQLGQSGEVLLRTRVLLHDAYQCQGGNIITWCEPERRNLALSFQDNAGCKDIWQHILDVQWSDLDSIVDVIAGGQIQQREDLLIFLSQSDCAYIKALLQLFHVGEENLEYGGLATLAVCVKSILLLNDPEIIEYVTTDVQTFEAVCAALEYDPELRERANHRWYIREQAKFRTVVKMEDEELISYIHRLFRVNYLRDTILRPTMDESSLSTLVSLAQFTQSDIIKGVIRGENENYLTKVLRMLGTEIKAIRKMKRKGCLSFLKELFNMARASLQQHEKEEFIATVVSMSVQLLEGGNVGSSLACGRASLEVLSVIAIHDPSIIRRHCLDAAAATSRDHDLLQSLLFIMSTETDAGLLLQTSEIIRIILDTEMMGEQGSLGNGFLDDENDFTSGGDFKNRNTAGDDSLRLVPPCAIRAAFTLEILSFCVRAHVYRMKLFVLRTRLLGTILKIVGQKSSVPMTSSDRCLILASLKLLRSVLSVKDEFYHRHIVQYNLFAPVFEVFRAIPVGNNLVSSTVLEMCDFIRTENIKSLLEYIVSKHLLEPMDLNGIISLEEIANPHVDTFKQLRKKHDENTTPTGGSRALEDQRKFRETDEEENYFNEDFDEEEEV